MEAKRCDRCGKFFCEKDYEGNTTPCVKEFGPNGATVPINWIGRGGSAGSSKWLDMCYSCKEEFVTWWKEAQNDTNN